MTKQNLKSGAMRKLLRREMLESASHSPAPFRADREHATLAIKLNAYKAIMPAAFHTMSQEANGAKGALPLR